MPESVFDFTESLKNHPQLFASFVEFFKDRSQNLTVRTFCENVQRLRYVEDTATVSRLLQRLKNSQHCPTPSTLELLAAGLSYENVDSLVAAFRKHDEKLQIPAWVALSPHPTRSDSADYAAEISRGIEQLRDASRDLVYEEVKKRVMHIMGTLTECFGARSSWLFVKLRESGSSNIYFDRESTLKLQFHHNTGVTELEFGPDANPCSVVRFVAMTRRPFLSNNLRSGWLEHVFRDENPRTQSELTVPILVSDADGNEQVIGVFNLESNKEDAFLECHQGELMAAATELAPELLVFQHLEFDKKAFGWHPNTHGWTLARLLEAFCAKVADQRQTNPTFLPRPSCTIWYIDRSEQMLFVRGTARFDYEYTSARGLPISGSFTGIVAGHAKGAVGHGTPSDLPFARTNKASDMGMVYAFASPIYAPDDQKIGHSLGTINLYFFQEELPRGTDGASPIHPSVIEERFPKVLMERLASELGKLIVGCHKLKADVAAAYLRCRLHQYSVPTLTDFDTVKDVILECLDVEHCTLFGRFQSPENAWVLQCVATTGLQGLDGSIVDPSDAKYELGNVADRGLTVFLAEKPGHTLRCRSTVDLTYRNRNNDEPVPVNKYRETYSHSDMEHRPFLGISVQSSDATAAASAPAASVIRIMRKSGSTPFVHSDALLLHRLGKESRASFSRWSKGARYDREKRPILLGARYPYVLRVVRDSPSAAQLDAIDDIGAPFTAGTIWNKRHVDAVLLDLIDLYRNAQWRRTQRHGALIANLRLCPSGLKGKLRVYAVHALLSSDPPSEKRLHEHSDAIDSIGVMTLDQDYPITFNPADPAIHDRFRPILDESSRVISGVCMPVRFVSQNGTFGGVLSVDCDDMRLQDWRSEHLEVIALAARKLSFIGRDNRLRDETIYQGETWHDAFRDFRESVKSIGVMTPNLFESSNPRRRLFIEPKQEMFEQLSQTWDRLHDVTWSDSGTFKINLRFGSFPANLALVGKLNFATLTGPQELPHEQRIKRRIVEIIHLWDRFVSTRVGTGAKSLFRLSFREEKPKDGLVFWKHDISLAPDLFGRGLIS